MVIILPFNVKLILTKCKKEKIKSEEYYYFSRDEKGLNKFKIFFFLGSMYSLKTKFKTYSCILWKYSISISKGIPIYNYKETSDSFYTFNNEGQKRTLITSFLLFGKKIMIDLN